MWREKRLEKRQGWITKAPCTLSRTWDIKLSERSLEGFKNWEFIESNF
jgi:uncharacterized membrane protein